MSDKLIVAGAIGVLIASGAGVYYATRKKPVTPSTTSTTDYKITLSGPSSVKENSNETYSGTLTLNGSPVSNATVLLSVNGNAPTDNATDADGNYSFDIGFTSAGTVTLKASSEGATASMTVTVSKVSTCTSSSNCPSGYNCVNGQCEKLIPYAIKMPVDYVVSGYEQYTKMMTFDFPDPVPVAQLSMIVSSDSSKPFCPTAYKDGTPSSSYTIELEFTGSVVDASGAGVSGVDVSGDVSGGGPWTAHASGGQEFSGNASPSLKSSSGTTDSNGKFTFTVIMNVTVEFSENGGGYNTSYYNMGIPAVTLSVSSGALPSTDTIISFDEYIASHLCQYTYGVELL